MKKVAFSIAIWLTTVGGVACANGPALGDFDFLSSIRNGQALSSSRSPINGFVVEWMGDSISCEFQPGIARVSNIDLGCTRIKGYMTGTGPAFDSGIACVLASPSSTRSVVYSDWDVFQQRWYWSDVNTPHEIIPSSMGPQSVIRWKWTAPDVGNSAMLTWSIQYDWIASHVSVTSASQWSAAARARLVYWATPNSVHEVGLRARRSGDVVASITFDASSESSGIRFAEIAIPPGIGAPSIEIFPTSSYDPTGKDLIVEGAVIWVDDDQPSTVNLVWNRGGTTSAQLVNPAYLDPVVHNAWRDAFGGVDATALWIGTNDVWIDYATTAANIHSVAANAKSYMAARGREPLQLFVMPYQDANSSHAGLQIVEGGMIAAAGEFNGALADLLAACGAYQDNAMFLSDGVHPNALGGEHYARVIVDLLQAGGCYANCDASTNAPVLSVADFVCFLTRFRANDTYANCDGSTTPPTLSVADFVCYLAKFRAGCP